MGPGKANSPRTPSLGCRTCHIFALVWSPFCQRPKNLCPAPAWVEIHALKLNRLTGINPYSYVLTRIVSILETRLRSGPFILIRGLAPERACQANRDRS